MTLCGSYSGIERRDLMPCFCSLRICKEHMPLCLQLNHLSCIEAMFFLQRQKELLLFLLEGGLLPLHLHLLHLHLRIREGRNLIWAGIQTLR